MTDVLEHGVHGLGFWFRSRAVEQVSRGDNDFIVSDDTLLSATQFEVDSSPSSNPHTYVGFVQHPVQFLDGFESGDTTAWSSSSP